jgi:hypothetical protein
VRDWQEVLRQHWRVHRHQRVLHDYGLRQHGAVLSRKSTDVQVAGESAVHGARAVLPVGLPDLSEPTREWHEHIVLHPRWDRLRFGWPVLQWPV